MSRFLLDTHVLKQHARQTMSQTLTIKLSDKVYAAIRRLGFKAGGVEGVDDLVR